MKKIFFLLILVPCFSFAQTGRVGIVNGLQQTVPLPNAKGYLYNNGSGVYDYDTTRTSGRSPDYKDSVVKYAWGLTGNSSTTPGTNFIGTTDAHALELKVNSTFAGIINHTSPYNTTYGVSTNNTGQFNSAFGYGALESNSGNHNSAFGFEALFDNSTGVSNTAVGYEALFSNGGSGCTAVGNQAGWTNIGYYSTFVGDSAGFSNSSGKGSTFLGFKAGVANTLGNYNAFVGDSAGAYNTTGSGNSGGGSSSLERNQTGSSNAAYGKQSLHFNTADQNTAVGDSAGFNNTTGTNNGYFGYGAGDSNKTGSNTNFYGNYNTLHNNFNGAFGLRNGNSYNEGTSGQMIISSGGGATPAWTTATYPSTTTINQILYSSAANTVTGLATANSSILATNGSGVPSLTTALPNGITATTQSTLNNGTDVATTAYADNQESNLDKAFTLMGAPVHGWPVGVANPYQFTISTTQALASGTSIWVMTYVTTTTTLTGVEFLLQTAGNYTGNNYNGWGLYSVNTSTGALTLVDSTTNNSSIWTATANTWTSAAWASTYSASPGVYMVCALYHESAQTTAPILYIYYNTIAATTASLPFAHNMVLAGYIAGLTVLPASRASSALTGGNYQISFYLY